jgi:hypothetical protein
MCQFFEELCYQFRKLFKKNRNNREILRWKRKSKKIMQKNEIKLHCDWLKFQPISIAYFWPFFRIFFLLISKINKTICFFVKFGLFFDLLQINCQKLLIFALFGFKGIPVLTFPAVIMPLKCTKSIVNVIKVQNNPNKKKKFEFFRFLLSILIGWLTNSRTANNRRFFVISDFKIYLLRG